MNLDRLRAKLRLDLRKVGPPPTEPGDRLLDDFHPPHEMFPVPALVLFALRDGLGLRVEGPFEKVRWSIPFTYDGALYYVELRKFGFTVISETVHPEGSNLTREVLRKLVKAVQTVERELEGLAKEQAQKGIVGVENRFHYLDEAYRFFRERASRTYRRGTRRKKTKPAPDGSPPNIFGEGTPWSSSREAGHLAGAMVNAYLSRTEHLLCLSLPFTPFNPTDGGLLRFIAMPWPDKMRTLFDLSTDPAKSLHERVMLVRDRLRNPLSHGGFESKGASLWFRLPKVGMLPARLSRHRDGFHFIFTPVGDEGFRNICSLFDEFDAFLKLKIRYGWAWLLAGLDVNYDPKSRAEYATAMRSPDHFEKLIERTAWEHDRHANFEY